MFDYTKAVLLLNVMKEARDYGQLQWLHQKALDELQEMSKSNGESKAPYVRPDPIERKV